MSCQILSALLLEARSPQHSYSTAHWRSSCSRSGRLSTGYASKEVSMTIWAESNVPKAHCLNGFKSCDSPRCFTGRHVSFKYVTLRGRNVSTVGINLQNKKEITCFIYTDEYVFALKYCVFLSSTESPVSSLRVRSHRFNWRLYTHVRQHYSTSGSSNETQRFVLLS